MKKEPKLVIIAALLLIVLLASILLVVQFFPRSPNTQNVRVGIVDSGCNQNQAFRVVDYKTFTFRNYSFPVDESSVFDSIGHGSTICQIIIEESPNAEIYSAKVANSNGLLTYDALFAAVKYLVEEKEVNIINLSLGGEPYFTEELNTAFKEYADEVLMIAAVGNRGSTNVHTKGLVDWPASLPWIVGVGSGGNTFLDSYSSFGRTLNGTSVVELVDNGQVGSNFGTSFSTPHVTAIFANILSQLLDKNLDPTPSSLMYLGASNSKSIDFKNEIGWGKLERDANIKIEPGIIFQISDYYDPFVRFPDEEWMHQIKFYSHDQELLEGDIQITGNGSDFISHLRIQQNDWGGLLSLYFSGPSPSGIYVINLNRNDIPQFSMQFEISAVQPKKILFDHRFSVSGFAHEFGDYELISKFLRDNKVLPVHSYFSDETLEDYDQVFVAEMGKILRSDDRVFNREYQDEGLERYLNYVNKGGRLQIALNHPDEFDFDHYNDTLAQFALYSTGKKIPRSGGNAEVASVSNLTREVNLFLKETDYILMRGTGLESLNSSVQAVGWYMDRFFDGVSTTTSYIPIGYFGDSGLGNYFVWSGSSMVKDEYFAETGDTFDQFLLEYINN